MNPSIIKAIDDEIARLQQAKALLTNSSDNPPIAERRRGRPKGSKNAAKAAPAKAKRTMSAEGRARIAAAQKKRWAAKKRATKKLAGAAAS